MEVTHDALRSALEALDAFAFRMTSGDVYVLESLRTRRSPPTQEQLCVLSRLVEKYLRDDALAAEVLGQQRLW